MKTFRGTEGLRVITSGEFTLLVTSRPPSTAEQMSPVTGTITIDAEWSVVPQTPTAYIQNGTYFNQAEAFTNNGGFTRFPGVHPFPPSLPVEGITAGPTAGYVYLEMRVSGGTGGTVGGPEASPPWVTTAALEEGTGFEDKFFSAGTIVSNPSSAAGGSHVVFYEDLQEPSNSFYRIPLARITLDGEGVVTGVQRIHYGVLMTPFGTSFTASASLGQD